MLPLTGKPKGDNSHRWDSPGVGRDSVSHCSDDTEAPSLATVFIYSFFQQTCVKRLLHALC